MKVLMDLFEQDWLRGVLYTAIAVGVVAVLFGAYSVISAELALRDNMAYQMRDQEITLETPTQQTLLFSSDLERRKLVSERWSGMVVGGSGLVVLSIGWMLLNVTNDIREKRRQRGTQAETPA